MLTTIFTFKSNLEILSDQIKSSIEKKSSDLFALSGHSDQSEMN